MIRSLRKEIGHLLLMMTVGIFLGACVNSEPDSDSLFRQNRPPVANAGPDQTVPSGARVLLEGSGSDPDGNEIRYEWRMVQTPEGSSAQLDTPASPTVGFVADTDGVYRIELRVVEEIDQNIPEGAPIENTGAISEPDEVMVIAGDPGAFENAGNKLILDGSHFALSTTLLDIGDPPDIGDKLTVAPNTQLNEMTAEGWFFAAALPAAGTEALLVRKKDFFELVLTSNADLLLRITTRDEQNVTLAAPFSIGRWHHIAAVIAGRSQHRAYLAIDGVIYAAGNFTGLFNNNSNRITIGGGASKAFLVGMADEIRITQDVRYPEGGFDPPKERLIQDSPFVAGARFAVHGLWHFDESAGAKLFTDFSLRRNDLFLVGDTGFQPFGRLTIPRRFHTVVPLAEEDGDLWITGGIDDADRALAETEVIQTDDQIKESTSLNLPPIQGEQLGVGNGTTRSFTLQTATQPVLPGSVTLTAGNIRGTDDSEGNLTGDGIESGTINYDTGAITITFKSPPYVLRINSEELGSTAGGGSSFSATADFTPIVPESLSIRVGGGVIAEDDGSGNLTGSNVQSGTVNSNSVNYTTGAINITFRNALGNDVKVLTRYDYNNQVLIPGNGMPITIDYSFDRRGGIFNHTATRLSDGKILIAGGDDKNRQAVGLATLFNPSANPPATQPITLVGPHIIPRRYHTAGLLSNGEVILVGGETGSGNSVRTLHETELFDPLALEFRGASNQNQNLRHARKLHRMISLRDCNKDVPEDNRFLVVGGYDIDNRPTKTAELFSGVAFVETGSMSVERIRHAVVCLPPDPNGNIKILVTGGIDANGRVLNSAEIYDPVSGLFTRLQAGMNIPRADHTATLLPNGKVLIAGGFNQSAPALASAEIYDPVQNLFTLLPDTLGLARFGHVALPWTESALNKEGVLLIGGGNADRTPISLIEIFLP